MRLTRRQILKGIVSASAGATLALGGIAVAEPWRLLVTRYAMTPRNWPKGLKLRCAVLTDIHACEPWMDASRIRQIVNRTNATKPDVVLLLGDYVAGKRLAHVAKPLRHAEWAAELARLEAPNGVHAVLGNHDWWEEIVVQLRRSGPTPAGEALRAAGIKVYENEAVRLMKGGEPFWVAGLGDQWAFFPKGELKPNRHGRFDGVHDLKKTLRAVTDDAPVILMAHEPDIFPQVPGRVALTLSGHTHGGQVVIGGYAPVVPSRYKQRYLYGHVVEDDRHLVVSAGLGCSGLPLRFGRPPEIVVIDVGSSEGVA